MGVGERPEIPDQEERPADGRGNGRKNGSTRGKRGRPRRTAAALGVEMEDDTKERGARGGGSGDGNGGGTRDRSLRRLLAGLRALDAGDFSIRIDTVDDRLMGELADVFNSVATKQQRLAEELDRVALSVGRRSAPPILSPPATLPVAGALLGLWLVLLVEIIRSFADSHGQLLANWGMNDAAHRR